MWRLPAFGISLFLVEIGRSDVRLLLRSGAPPDSIKQLQRCVPSIKANIAEGYSRFSGKDRARFYETALASAREAREWYRDLGTWLGRSAAEERGMLLTRVIKVLTVAIPQEREGASEARIRAARERRAGEAQHPAPAPSPSPSNQFQQQGTSNQRAALLPSAAGPSANESLDQVDSTKTGQ